MESRDTRDLLEAGGTLQMEVLRPSNGAGGLGVLPEWSVAATCIPYLPGWSAPGPQMRAPFLVATGTFPGQPVIFLFPTMKEPDVLLFFSWNVHVTQALIRHFWDSWTIRT